LPVPDPRSFYNSIELSAAESVAAAAALEPPVQVAAILVLGQKVPILLLAVLVHAAAYVT
jgi:hypothetical protein